MDQNGTSAYNAMFFHCILDPYVGVLKNHIHLDVLVRLRKEAIFNLNTRISDVIIW